MYRSSFSKFVDQSAITVTLLLAFTAQLAAEDVDPRQRTEPKANIPISLETGSSLLLQDQAVSGGPATAQIRLTPVATHPGGAYNTGGYYTSANISGQRLRVGFSGGRTYWNAQISGWAPDLMTSWQAAISNNSLLGTSADCGGGAGSCPGAGNLTYALQPCSTSADCTGAFGEPGINGHEGANESVCESGFCHSPFVNHTRSDWTHASVADPWGGAFGLFGGSERGVWASGPSNDPVTDGGLIYYGGTIVIDVPENARGLYTINWNPANTFIADASSPPSLIPIAAMIPGELEITCLCNANVNNDGFVNAIDENIVLDCINGDCSGCASDCDVNCDGAVDWVDMGIVRCQLMGISDCCNAATGACLGINLGIDYEACQVTTTMTCNWFAGTYLGNDTTCVGCVCNADVNNDGKVQLVDAACVADCAQGLGCACCVNGCDVNCDQTVDWTDFAAVWCEFEGGSNCCNVVIGACIPANPGWPECVETSQNACESNGGAYSGNGSTCPELCPATRVFEDADYCPGRVDLVRIELGSLAGVSAISVADSPPAGWTVGAISNGGSYDAVNHKVKWGPLFSPFPAELTYEVTPNEAATGQLCFSGVISVDGVNRTFCGDNCLNYQCCPFIAAETPQPVCGSCAAGNCAACTSGSCQDGSVSLCEVIAYGCAWVRGCNDDIAAVTRAAFIWRNGECYCWDDASLSFLATACGAGNTCCPTGGAAAVLEESSIALGSAQARVTRSGLRGGSRDWQVAIDVVPAVGTSAAAVELIVPLGWTVVAVGEDGAFDPENGKIKWGPYFGDAVRTLTAAVHPAAGRIEGKVRLTKDAVRRGLRGTVSFDGVNSPVTITR